MAGRGKGKGKGMAKRHA
ncbi:hypothetical protein KIPB_004704, partial [Kipferlia bialata]